MTQAGSSGEEHEPYKLADGGSIPPRPTKYPWRFEVCQVCGAKNVAAFRVSDRMWAAVVGAPEGILCLLCFDALAAEQGIDWLEEPIEFHPMSSVANAKWGETEEYCLEVLEEKP